MPGSDTCRCTHVRTAHSMKEPHPCEVVGCSCEGFAHSPTSQVHQSPEQDDQVHADHKDVGPTRRARRWRVHHASVDAAKVVSLNMTYLGEDTFPLPDYDSTLVEELVPRTQDLYDARTFLARLAVEANAEDVVDGPWWMGLQRLIDKGWRIVPPEEDR